MIISIVHKKMIYNLIQVPLKYLYHFSYLYMLYIDLNYLYIIFSIFIDLYKNKRVNKKMI